jgi:hypothetical protein
MSECPERFVDLFRQTLARDPPTATDDGQ